MGLHLSLLHLVRSVVGWVVVIGFLLNFSSCHAKVYQPHTPGEKHIGKPQELPFAGMFQEVTEMLNDRMDDFDKVIWHLYNATALDIDFDSDLEDEHLEESLEDDLEQEENKGKKEKRDRLHGLIPDVKDATSLQAITVALTGFEKLLLTTANKIEINMTPAVIKLTNITTDADINADGNAVDDGKYLFLPMKMLGVKMGQITLLLEPALDALLGTSSTNEIQKLGLLTGIECIIRAADRIVSPLQSQARHLHNVPFSLPFIILRANIENLQTRLDDEWWNRWYRYNSGRRKYNGLTNEMAGAGSGRRRAGQNQGGRRGGCLNI